MYPNSHLRENIWGSPSTNTSAILNDGFQGASQDENLTPGASSSVCPQIIRPVRQMPGNNTDQNSSDHSQKKVKRPMNAFMLWAREERKRIAKENPKMHNSEISQILGKTWKKLPKDEQKPFFDKAEQLREQHNKDHPNYKYRPIRKKAKGTSKKNKAEMMSDHPISRRDLLSPYNHSQSYKKSSTPLPASSSFPQVSCSWYSISNLNPMPQMPTQKVNNLELSSCAPSQRFPVLNNQMMPHYSQRYNGFEDSTFYPFVDQSYTSRSFLGMNCTRQKKQEYEHYKKNQVQGSNGLPSHCEERQRSNCSTHAFQSSNNFNVCTLQEQTNKMNVLQSSNNLAVCNDDQTNYHMLQSSNKHCVSTAEKAKEENYEINAFPNFINSPACKNQEQVNYDMIAMPNSTISPPFNLQQQQTPMSMSMDQQSYSSSHVPLANGFHSHNSPHSSINSVSPFNQFPLNDNQAICIAPQEQSKYSQMVNSSHAPVSVSSLTSNVGNTSSVLNQANGVAAYSNCMDRRN